MTISTVITSVKVQIRLSVGQKRMAVKQHPMEIINCMCRGGTSRFEIQRFIGNGI